MSAGAMAQLTQNRIFMLFLIAIILGAVLTPIGLAFFGVTILSVSIIGVLIAYFIPAILVLLALLVILGIIPTPGWYWRIGLSIFLFILAYGIWDGWLAWIT